MYSEYFGLTETPFSIAPDPRYLYMSERHREALAHLVYGLNSDGAFILLTGDVGTGKTTVSRCLLQQIPDNTHIALVLNPKVSSKELLQTICDELGIFYCKNSGSIKDHVDLINSFLLSAHAQGEKTVVLIEEAQNLDLDVLEQLRLLTNLETNEHKLLQIILLGQPEFLDVLERPDLSQLAQRITARYHLTPLNYNEMLAYINHRLAVSGCRQNLFNNTALKRLYKISKGTPRVINLICDRALLGCYVQNKSQVNRVTLDNAAKEVLGENGFDQKAKTSNRMTSIWVTGIAAAIFLIFFLVTVQFDLYSWGQLKDKQVAVENVEDVSLVEMAQQVSSVEKNMQHSPSVHSYQPVWPDTIDRFRSNSLAFQNLFTHWKLDYNPQKNGTPCFFAQSSGLSCYRGNASIKEIREINRPAVLQLKDTDGQIHYATLTGMGYQLATLVLAGEKQTWSLLQLNDYWSGDFTLLWKTPPGYLKAIHPDHEGQDVAWLSHKINLIDPSDDIPEGSVYQGQLIEKVRQFQVIQGLQSDGVVGAQTLIRINNVTGLDAPILKITDS